MSHISARGRKSGDLSKVKKKSAKDGERGKRETYAEDLAAEPRVKLNGELERLGRSKVRSEEHLLKDTKLAFQLLEQERTKRAIESRRGVGEVDGLKKTRSVSTEKERRRTGREDGPERSTVNGGSLRLVNLDPEHREEVRHGLRT